MRRKFYTKQDYQHMPNGATKRPANVGAQPLYKVRIPKQLRLEPWDYDYEVPTPHVIQLFYVDPPGGVYDDDAEKENVADDVLGGHANPMLLHENRRGVVRNRDEADLDADLIVRVGGTMRGTVRRARANPQETPPRGPRTPGLAVQANRERERVALRTARTRRNLDLQQFQRETETRRGQVGLRYNPPAGLGNAGLPPRKRGPP